MPETTTALAEHKADLQTLDQGSPLPVFSGAMMTKALQAYRDLQKALDESMPDQIMELEGRPFRKKGYWRAVAVAFNLSVEPIGEAREVNSQFDDGRENFGHRVTYKATAPNGRVATGDGSCFAIEKARRFKCPHPEGEGSKRTVHFPHETCPDYDPSFQWRTLPGQATEHNIRSHAHTRAFNRAVSNLVGFGEVSAEEMERDEHVAVPEPKRAETMPARADGAVQIVKVDEKKGVSAKGKPWSRATVTCSDGRSGSTFDGVLIAEAKAAQAQGRWLVPTFEQDGKFTNLVTLAPAPKETPPPLPVIDTEPVGEPERILTVREAKTAQGTVYWLIQSDRREYATNLEGVKALAEQLKDGKRPAYIEFERVTVNGHSYNKVTEFGEAAAQPKL